MRGSFSAVLVRMMVGIAALARGSGAPLPPGNGGRDRTMPPSLVPSFGHGAPGFPYSSKGSGRFPFPKSPRTVSDVAALERAEAKRDRKRVARLLSRAAR